MSIHSRWRAERSVGISVTWTSASRTKHGPSHVRAVNQLGPIFQPAHPGNGEHLQMIVRVERTIRQTTAREKDAHAQTATSTGVRSRVWHKRTPSSSRTADLDTHGLVGAGITSVLDTGDHAQTGREGFDIGTLDKVVDTGSAHHGCKSVVGVAVVQLPMDQWALCERRCTEVKRTGEEGSG